MRPERFIIVQTQSQFSVQLNTVSKNICLITHFQTGSFFYSPRSQENDSIKELQNYQKFRKIYTLKINIKENFHKAIIQKWF